MALAPIPSKMLHDSVTFQVVTGLDRYQNKTYEPYDVKKVHLQASNETIKGVDNTEVQLRGILFVDAKKSTPVLDLHELQQQSLSNGDTMRAIVYDASGNEVGNYAVLVVNDLPDVPATRRHHWELSLV